jgi:hypothetical protein
MAYDDRSRAGDGGVRVLPEWAELEIEEWEVAGKRKAEAAREASAPKAPRTSTRKQRAAGVASEATATSEVAATGETERGLSDVDALLLEMGGQSASAEGESAGEAPVDPGAMLPAIDPLATFWTELDLRCRDCSIIHYVNFCTLLNAEESPHLVERARRNQFNYKRCPVCRKIEYVEHPWTFYDPQRKLVVQIRPEWEWHAGGGEEWYAARLEDLFDKWAEYDVRLDVTFGPEQFIERYLIERYLKDEES